MNKLLTLSLVAALSFANAACAKEEPKKSTPVAAPAAAAAPATPAKPAEAVPAKKDTEEPTTKRVCITVTDGKTGKPVEKCRETKIHKKYEGTAVPTK
jgi:hypothetical protein